MHTKLISIISVWLLVCFSQNKTTAQSNKDRPELSFYVVGSSGVKARFGLNVFEAVNSLRTKTDKLDEFLLSIAKEPLSTEMIKDKCNLTQSQIEYLINNLDSFNIIKKYNLNHWATTLPVITDKQMKIIRDDLSPMANSVAQFLKIETLQVKTLYNKVKSQTDPPWDDVSHLIISKFIIDGTFHSNLNRLKREKDNRKISVIPAYFLQRGGNNIKFGCNWYKFKKGDDQREIYVLHGAILDRYDIAMNKYRWDKEFSASLFRISNKGEIDSLTNREKEKMNELQWIEGDRLVVPVIKAETIKELWPTLEKIGAKAADTAFTKYSCLEESYNKSDYSKFLSNKEDYIQVLIHSLFGLIIEHLEESGTVSKVPKPVPEFFGVFIVSGFLF